MKFTNFGKKLFALLAVVLFGVVLVACNNGNNNNNEEEELKKQHQANVTAVLNAIVFDQTQLDEVTGNLIFVDKNGKYPDVAISWATSEGDIIANDGTVTRPALDDSRIEAGKDYVKVNVTVTASQGEASSNKTFTFKVIAEKKVDVSNVQAIKRSFYTLMQEAGNKYSDKTSDMGVLVTVTGKLIYKVSTKGYLVNDGTGAIYVYGTTSANVGDTVQVSGKAYAYYGLVEIGADVTCEVVADKNVNALTFRETTIEEYTAALDAALDADGKIVDVEAFMGFSTEALNLYAKVEKGDRGSGDDYYLVDPTTGKSVAIYHYCTDDEADAAKIEAMVGKYVKINVYSYDTHSSLADKYRVVWDGSEIVEAQGPTNLTDEQKVSNELGSLAVDKLIIENITLPTGEGVSWALKATSANAVIEEGVLKVTRPSYGAENTKVTLVATCTIGAATDSKEFEVEIVAAFDPTIAEVKPFVAGTAYKFGFYQVSKIQYLFITGEMDGYYGATTDNGFLGATVTPVEVAGGYQLKLTVGEAVKYIELVQSGKYTNVKYNDVATEGYAWQYNEEYNTFTYEFTEGEYAGVYYLGTYGSNVTLSASKISYAATSYVAHLFVAEGSVVEQQQPIEPAEGTHYVAKYTGESTGNMTGGNDAATLGLDATKFSVVGTFDGNNYPGLNKAGEIRLYKDKGENKSAITFTMTDGIIKQIVIEVSDAHLAMLEVTVNGEVVEGVAGVYNINAASFTITNIGTGTANIKSVDMIA